MSVAPSPTSTAAPGGDRLVVLFDGTCRFCTREAKRLRGLGGDQVELRSFQDDGVLDAFPGITHEAAMQRIHAVTPEGRVYAGAEAIARILTIVPAWGWIGFGYYVPGVRQLAELGYRLVAKYRYRLLGRGDDACDGGTCHLH
jgi:predicted DCC family thiol-disulfide oxidoreductase YuxK